MHRARLALGLAASIAAGGCAPGAHLTPMPVLQSTAWTGEDLLAGAEPAAAGEGLASLLGSAELVALTDRGLARNADIAIAQARVAQSQALLRQARAATLPEVSLGGAATQKRTLASTLPDARNFSGQLDVALDLDLFGRLASAKTAARERTRAAQLTRDAVALAVETDIAAAFVQRAALERRIGIVDQNIDRAAELERVIRVRVDEGAASKVDLGLQSIQLLNLRDKRSRLVQSLDQTRTALALLAGDEAPQFQSAPGKLDQLALPGIATPSPTQVMAARPDILAAEALIAAANGDVEVARASFMPQVGLSLSGLATSAGTGPLGKIVSLGSSLLAPIFARGRLRGELELAGAQQAETVEAYRRTLLTVLNQVEDARTAITQSAARAELMDRILSEAEQTARLSNLQYLEGEEDLQTVIDAQQFLAEAEESQALALQEQLDARIALYRAIGGRQAAGDATPPRLSY